MKRPIPPENVVIPGPKWWPDAVGIVVLVGAGGYFVYRLLLWDAAGAS